MFHTLPDDEKLSKESAKFVDVIHAAGLWIGTDEVVTNCPIHVYSHFFDD